MNKIWDSPNIEEIELEEIPQTRERCDNLSVLYAGQEKLEKRCKENITFCPPIITRNDKPLIFPRTINVIQGKQGVHKSRLAELFASILLSKTSETILDFKANLSNNCAVVYVDTERNITDQFPAAIQNIKRNAGFDIIDEIKHFEFVTLLEIKREERLETLSSFLKDIRDKYSNHVIIIIDVLTDCINNFNDEKESLKFIDILNELINNFDITIIGLIHENPSKADSKARGHIGTEIVNKASTVISLAFQSDKSNIVEIKYIKCRSTERYAPIYAKYDPNLKTLVAAEEYEVNSMKQNKAPMKDVALSLIRLLKNNSKERKEILPVLCNEYDCSERTMITRLDEMFESKYLNQFGYNLFYEAVENNDRNKKLYYIHSLTRED